MGSFLLASCLLLASFTRVASSVANEDPGNESTEDYACSLYCRPHRAEVVPACIGSPFVLYPNSPSYTLVPTNYSIQQPFYRYNSDAPSCISGSQYLLNGKNAGSSFNSDISKVGSGQSVVNTANTEEIKDDIDNYHSKTAEDPTGWYPTEETSIYSPGYDYEKYPERRKYITFPYTIPGSYPTTKDQYSSSDREYAYDNIHPELDQAELPSDRIVQSGFAKDNEQQEEILNPFSYQSSVENFDYGYGLRYPAQQYPKYSQYSNIVGTHGYTTSNKFGPLITQGYGNDQSYSKPEDTKLSSTSYVQNDYIVDEDTITDSSIEHGYPKNKNYGYRYDQLHPKQEDSGLSSTTVVQNGYTTDEGYNSYIKHGYPNNKNRGSLITNGYGYDQLHPKQEDSVLSSTTVVQNGYTTDGIYKPSIVQTEVDSSNHVVSPAAKSSHRTNKFEESLSQQAIKYSGHTVSNLPAAHGIPTQPAIGYETLATEQIIPKFPSATVIYQNGNPNKYVNVISTQHVCGQGKINPNLHNHHGVEYDNLQDQELSKPFSSAIIQSHQTISSQEPNADIQGVSGQVSQTQADVSINKQTINNANGSPITYEQLYQKPEPFNLYPTAQAPLYGTNTYGSTMDHDYTTKPFISKTYGTKIYPSGNAATHEPSTQQFDYGYKEELTEQPTTIGGQITKPTGFTKYGVSENPSVHNRLGDNKAEPTIPSDGKTLQDSLDPYGTYNTYIKEQDEFGYNKPEQFVAGQLISSSKYFHNQPPGSIITPTGPGVLNNQNYGSNLQTKQVPGLGNTIFNNGIYNTGPSSAYQLGLQEPPATSSYEEGATERVPATENSVTSSPGPIAPQEFPELKFLDGCSLTQSQLEDIVNSFKVPEKCVLTVPHIFSGPLDQFAHVMNCFPDSMDVKDGFVHLPSDLLVPYDCYKHIASVYASDLPLFKDTNGVVLADGRFVDSLTVASIIASTRTPDFRNIITENDLVIPFDIFKNYINKITTEDKKHLRVLLPGIKEPVYYDTFKEVFEKYVGKFHNNVDEKKTVKLLGSKTELSLEQFLAVLENCRAMKKAVVSLPNKKTIPLLSFIPIASILGDNYTKSCLINIPNTPHTLPFTVVREIFKIYLEKGKIDLSKDTDVNWNFEGKRTFYDDSDVEIFCPFDKHANIGQAMPTSHAKSTVQDPEQTYYGESDFQEPHYLLCHPKYSSYKPDGAVLYTGGEHLDRKYVPPPPTQPVYACERFEKYNPQTSHH